MLLVLLLIHVDIPVGGIGNSGSLLRITVRGRQIAEPVVGPLMRVGVCGDRKDVIPAASVMAAGGCDICYRDGHVLFIYVQFLSARRTLFCPLFTSQRSFSHAGTPAEEQKICCQKKGFQINNQYTESSKREKAFDEDSSSSSSFKGQQQQLFQVVALIYTTPWWYYC
jgi:hypothetical protein